MNDLRNARFKPGQRIRVKIEFKPGHVRTPFYIKGKTGRVQRVYGAFRNPEALAYGRDGLPCIPLYEVGFDQKDVWEHYAAAEHDKVFLDIFEHWLEPDED